MEFLRAKSAGRRFAIGSIPPALVLCVGAAVYSNTLNVPFLLDDSARIVDEPAIRSVWPPSVAMEHSNRPFANYTFAINYALHGLDLPGYHLVNLAIHLGAALCLLGIVRRSMLRCCSRGRLPVEIAATSVALIWVAHPLQTQAVTYIVQRLESLMGLAYLATLYFFIRAQDSKFPARWYGLSLVACALGMGCKEVMVTAPLMLLWYDRAFLATSWRELISKRMWFYGLLASTWLVLAWAILHDTTDYTSGVLINVNGLTPWTYLLSQTGVITHYLRLSIWPQGLCLFHDWPVTHKLGDVWPQAMLLTTLLVMTVASGIRFPRWSFLGGWFFLILAPTSSIAPIQHLAFEHRMYLPLAAVVGALVLSVGLLTSRIAGLLKASPTPMYLMISACVVFAFGVATFRRNSIYQSEISIWSDTLTRYPRNVLVLTLLANLYADEGQTQKAREYFLKALAVEPEDLEANIHYGGLLLEHGEFQGAQRHLDLALQIQPGNPAALGNQGALLLKTGRHFEAVACYQQALQATPEDHQLRISLTAALLASLRFEEVIRNCRIILSTKPDSADALINLACAERALGRGAAAIEHCRTALAIAPENPNAHATLAMFLSSDQPDLAIQLMREACRLAPKSPDFNLAMADLVVGRHPLMAKRFYKAALQANPLQVEAHISLAGLYEEAGQITQAITHWEAVAQLEPDWLEIRFKLQSLRALNFVK